MRDPKRIKRILKKLQEHWEEYPDLRFGQLLINMNIASDRLDTWQIEDDKWEEYLNQFKW